MKVKSHIKKEQLEKLGEVDRANVDFNVLAATGRQTGRVAIKKARTDCQSLACEIWERAPLSILFPQKPNGKRH